VVRFDGSQLSVEVRSPRLRVLRMAGVFNRVTVARLARLVATQVARPGGAGHIVVDLGEVSFFATDDLEPLRQARDGACAAGVHLHLAGVSAREALLPRAVIAALAEFSTFSTAERAEQELMGTPAVVVASGRPRSSHGWPCPPGVEVEDGRPARPGRTVTN
jgi:anti-anti-sigma regulatory factor